MDVELEQDQPGNRFGRTEFTVASWGWIAPTALIGRLTVSTVGYKVAHMAHS